MTMSDNSELELDIAQGRDPAALRPTPNRTGLDEWTTPADLCACLVECVLASFDPALPIWECAAGDGAIVDALRMAQRRVWATDIAPRREDIGRLDFLTQAPPQEIRGGILVTNPPFARSGLGDRFLRRGLELLDDGILLAVIFLQRGDASSTDGRAEIFNRSAVEFRANWRPRWIPGTTEGPRWWFAWHVWHAEHRGPPVTLRLRKHEFVRGG
jgi:hypothetical protein